MKLTPTLSKLVIVTSTIVLVVIAFFIHALAGLGASPVTFTEPPAFVEQYASRFNDSEQPLQPQQLETNHTPDETEIPAKWTRDYFNEAAMVRNVILNSESPEKLLQLFTHPEKEKRVKIAFAFGAVNIMMSHDDGSGYPEKRKQFWLDVEEHLPDIQNALFEALVVSAKEYSRNQLPYTIAWMPLNQQKKNEMLTWAAKHHPSPWVRRFCVYYVIKFGGNEELADSIIKESVHDPVFRVRNEVLIQRFRRFKESIFGTET